MKKVLSLIVALLLTLSAGYAQITGFPFTEGFEATDFPPAGWTVNNADGGGETWKKFTTTVHGGSNAARHNYSYGAQTGWLITPQLQLPAEGSQILEFWSYNQSPTYNEYAGVWISTGDNAPASFVELKQLEKGTEVSAAWKKISVPLSAYAGQTVYIAFKYAGNNADAWIVDDIDIHEFNLVDVAVAAINSPVSGKNLTAAEQVKVSIRNNGNAPATGFTLKLELNGEEKAVETFTGSIPSMEQTEYIFTQTLDLSAENTFSIKVTATLTGDEVADNNVKTASVTNTVCPVVTAYPWTEGFEGFVPPSTCWTAYNVDGGGAQWGKSTEHVNSGTGSASHAYSYSSEEGWLVTVPMAIPEEGNYRLEFYSFHQHASYNEYSGVWISTTDTGLASFTETKALAGTAEVSNSWKKIIVPLNDYAGQTIYIAFKYKGRSNGTNWCIDDLKVFDFNLTDVETVSIVTPASATNLTAAEQVKVMVHNNGSAPATGFTLKLEVNDEEKAVETFTGSISSMEQTEYTFTQTLDLSAEANYTVKVTVTLTGDEITDNDTQTVTVTNTVCEPVTVFPFTEGFNDTTFPPAGCWTNRNASGGTELWTRNTATVYSGEGAAQQGSSDEVWLITAPVAIPATGDFRLEFWSHNSLPASNTYTGVWVSTASNALTEFTEVKKLEGNELLSEWKKITIPLSAAYAGQTVFIGFKHIAGGGKTLDKWSVDDISVFDFTTYIDAEAVQITAPVSDDLLTGTETVTVQIRNNGGVALTGFDLALKLNGTEIAAETFTGSIPSMEETEYTFNTTLDLSAEGVYTITVKLNAEGDLSLANDSVVKTVKHLSSPSVPLFGYRMDDDVKTPSPRGFVSFRHNNTEDVTRLSDYTAASPAAGINAGEYLNGYFYGYTTQNPNENWIQPYNFVKIATDTWTEVQSVNVEDVALIPRDMAYDYSTGVMYGIGVPAKTADSGIHSLVTVNIETGATTAVGSMECKMTALACTTDGTLYAVDADGNFCSIDKTTGAVTIIGATGIMASNIQSMTFDHNTGKLFWALFYLDGKTNCGKLMEINPLTGAVTERGVIGANSRITGLHSRMRHAVDLSANPAEGGTIEGSGTYEYGAQATVKAIAGANYNFVNWTENGTEVSPDAEYSFTVTGDRTLVANFALKTYTIALSATEGGEVEGNGTYEHGEEVTITATPAANYNFVNWTENGTEVSPDAEYSFEVTANRTLVANFALKTYTIALSATAGGEVEGNGTYEHGEEVTITATPAANYNFINWTENDTEVSPDAEYSFEVTANRTLVANFALKTYTIALSATEGGEVEGNGTYEHGEEITITATPAANYNFINWTENDTEVSPDAEYSFEVTANRTLVANFALQQFEVTFNTPANGTLTVKAGEETIESGRMVDYNTDLVITAIPDDGYKLESLTVNGVAFASGGTHTVTGNVNIECTFTDDVGIDDNTLANITVYGNGNTVYIVNKNSVTLKLVQITDVLGRVVYDDKASCSVTIPVNGANGLYVVKLLSDDGKVLSAKVHLTR